MARVPPSSIAQTDMGARLRMIREARDLTQAAMGEIMGVTVTAVSAYESGRNRIDIVALARAASAIGFSLDYIALGDLSGLRFDLAQRIQALQRAQVGEGPRRRGRPATRTPSGPGSAPLVRDSSDIVPTHPAPSGVHETTADYVSRPKTRQV